MSITVFDDKFALAVVIGFRQINDFFYDDLVAYEDTAVADTITIISTHKEDEIEFFQIPFGEFVRRDGSPAGANVTDTVDYLNLQFTGQGEGGDPPSITSVDNATAISGEDFLFQVMADNGPIWFTESNLPSGLVLNQLNGRISGITTNTGGSPFSVSLGAVNNFGVGQQNFTLNVVPSGTFQNTYSTDFRFNRFHYCTGGTTNDFYFEGSDKFSFSTWVRFNREPSERVFLSRTQSNGEGYKVGLDRVGSQSRPFFELRGSSGALKVRAPSGITKEQWTHVAVTYDGSGAASGATIYIDGSAVVADVISNGFGGAVGNTDVRFLLGALWNNSALPSSRYGGQLDEVSVWADELSSSDITAIYNGGTPKDLSGEAFYGANISWWRMGDGDTFPIINDQNASNGLTMVNMTPANFDASTP